MTSKYFIWKLKEENKNYYSHPNTFHNKRDKWVDKVTITEYPYNDGNGSYLGLMTTDDKKTPILSEVKVVTKDDVISNKVITDDLTDKSTDYVDYMKELGDEYDYKFIEQTDVISLLNLWYPNKDGSAYFSLDKDGFTIIDNRPKDGLV